MPDVKESSGGKYFLIKKMGKLYLYLLILGRLVFVVERIPLPDSLPMNSTIIETSKFMILSVLGNDFVKGVCFLFLVLYSMYVAIESFIVLRDWIVALYANKIVGKK